MTDSDRAVRDRGFDCMGHSCHEEIVGAGMLIAENEVMDNQGQGGNSHATECEVIPIEFLDHGTKSRSEPQSSEGVLRASQAGPYAMDAEAMSKVVDVLHRNIVDIVREGRVQESRRTILASIEMIEAVHAQDGISFEDATAAYLELAKAVIEMTQ